MNILNFIFIDKLLEPYSISDNWLSTINLLTSIVVLIVIALLTDIITKKILLNLIGRFVAKSKTSWDDILLSKKLFYRIAHLIPAIVVYYLFPYAFENMHDMFVSFLQIVVTVYITIMWILIADSFVSGLHDIYLTIPISENRPIKGYVQVAKILIYLIGILVVLSIIFDKDLKYFFTGLGAFAAVLLLVFKDSILGLTASIQLSANNMVKIGDWISLPSHDADGTVLEITLNTVKIQNWDKTISTVPTYALIGESFKNWRGMEESGGRRIKRAINIDVQSVTFISDEIQSSLQSDQKTKDFFSIILSENSNLSSTTNAGLFRKYAEYYLKHHPKVNLNLTFLIRALQPTPKGLPIEFYLFSKVQEWAYYEDIQAEIVEHFIAVAPLFELRIFQEISDQGAKQLH